MRPGLVSLLLVLSAACGALDPSSPPPAAYAPSPGPVARFTLASAVPAFLDVPFPTDAYLTGGKVTTIPGVSAVVKQNSTFLTHELAKMNGFSRTAMSLFYVDDTSAPKDADGNPAFAKLDPASFPADEAACTSDLSSVYLLDLAFDLKAPDLTKARIPCRGMAHLETLSATARTLAAVGPARGVVLAPGHAYVAVLTNRVKTTSGKRVQASADFGRVQLADKTVPTLYTHAYQKATDLLLTALSKDGAKVVAVAPFTTHTMDSQLYALRDALEMGPPAVLTWDSASMAPMQPSVFAAPVGGKLPLGARASLDDWLGAVTASPLPDGSDDPDTNLPVRAHDQIALVGTGVFTAVNYLTHYNGADYNTLDTATFTTDGSGNVVPAPDAPTSKIWVSFAVPKTPMPVTGYPVVIVQHGLGGSREDILDIANPLCKQGWMVAAIDSVTFGARAPEASFQIDKSSDFAASSGARYSGPDGFGDADATGAHNGSTDLFGLLLDAGAIRDQFRQAALDTAQLVRVLHSAPDLSGLALGGATPRIDGSRIAYVGQSLGAIQGATAAAIEPRVSTWTLNVGGGGLLTELAVHGPVVGALLSQAGGINFGFIQGTFDEAHVLTTLLQTIVEPGDPLLYASSIVTSPHTLAGQSTKPRNVLQFEVLYDEWVPNESNEALARAGGWGLAAPNAGSNSGILDYKQLSNDPGRLALPSVGPVNGGTIHDTPLMGATALVVQASPATHAENMTASAGSRATCIPFANFPAGHPFSAAPASFTVPDPYLATQAAIVRFVGEAFSGSVPSVVPPAPPVRDLDADGVTDDQDPAPCDPSVK